jgi:diacylglycerol kinase (ATP)
MKIAVSFKYACNGLKVCLKTQANFRTHLLAATVAVATGAALHISVMQWLALMFCISMVLAAELLNTAVEKLCDHITPAHHPQIKIIKDLAAAAVLVTALGSLVTGLLIFVPAIIHLINTLSA